MDMQEFVSKAKTLGCGVEFNTYLHDGVNYCYIKMSNRGDWGFFVKKECLDKDLNITLDEIIVQYQDLMRKIEFWLPERLIKKLERSK